MHTQYRPPFVEFRKVFEGFLIAQGIRGLTVRQVTVSAAPSPGRFEVEPGNLLHNLRRSAGLEGAMGDRVIVAYRPKAGPDRELSELVNDHVPFLRRLGLTSDHPAMAMRGNEGVIVEVFEWKDEAIASAHEHSEVQALWAGYDAVCGLPSAS